MEQDKLETYKIAIETRNLEIKLFWQRSLFFAAFISAIFVGRSSIENELFTKLILSSSGFLITLAWLLANRGSKYWYESWETKINEIESDFTDKLFSTWEKQQDKFFLYKSRFYSVSKTAIYVTDLIFVGWFFLLLKDALSFFNLSIKFESTNHFTFTAYILFMALNVILLLTATRTSIPKEIKDQWKMK